MPAANEQAAEQQRLVHEIEQTKRRMAAMAPEQDKSQLESKLADLEEQLSDAKSQQRQQG
jgi:hypothetical protein